MENLSKEEAAEKRAELETYFAGVALQGMLANPSYNVMSEADVQKKVVRMASELANHYAPVETTEV